MWMLRKEKAPPKQGQFYAGGSRTTKSIGSTTQRGRQHLSVGSWGKGSTGVHNLVAGEPGGSKKEAPTNAAERKRSGQKKLDGKCACALYTLPMTCPCQADDVRATTVHQSIRASHCRPHIGGLGSTMRRPRSRSATRRSRVGAGEPRPS